MIDETRQVLFTALNFAYPGILFLVTILNGIVIEEAKVLARTKKVLEFKDYKIYVWDVNK